MRASEELMLGRTMLRPMRGILHTMRGNEEVGCALGMMNKAAGRIDYPEWMNRVIVPLPCDCYPGNTGCVAAAIVHLFDNHLADWAVMGEKWTIEMIADWLRAVEPSEEETNETNETNETKEEASNQGKEVEVCQ